LFYNLQGLLNILVWLFLLPIESLPLFELSDFQNFFQGYLFEKYNSLEGSKYLSQIFLFLEHTLFHSLAYNS
jgi:hypothetical protein